MSWCQRHTYLHSVLNPVPETHSLLQRISVHTHLGMGILLSLALSSAEELYRSCMAFWLGISQLLQIRQAGTWHWHFEATGSRLLCKEMLNLLRQWKAGVYLFGEEMDSCEIGAHSGRTCNTHSSCLVHGALMLQLSPPFNERLSYCQSVIIQNNFPSPCWSIAFVVQFSAY